MMIPYLGMLPPQSVDFERAVIGAILLESKSLTIVSGILRTESFYLSQHAKIYAAITDLLDAGIPIDILTVTNQLRKQGELESVGGPVAISKMTNEVASTANIEFHARVICEKYILREIIKVSAKAQQKAFSEDVDLFDLIDEFNSDVNKIMMENVKQDALPLRSLTGALVRDIEERQNSPTYTSGVMSGLYSVDQRLKGFKKTDLILLAGRPGMGKTAAALSAAINQAKMGIKAAIFSLEMSRKQLLERLVSIETGIDLEVISSQKLDSSRLEIFNRALGVIESLPIWIDDTPGLSVYDLRAKATRLKMQHGIDIIYVDYLQLCTLGSLSKKLATQREREISMISAQMKIIAGELDIPVIALSQLSREVEKRPNKRPIPSDLRDSGSLEQDASVIIFLYRPSVYGEDSLWDGTPAEGKAEWIIAKNRNGSVGTCITDWIAHLAKYSSRHAHESPWNAVPIKEHSDARVESISRNERFLEQSNNQTEDPF